MITPLTTTNAADLTGPWSQGIRVGNLIFTSGQVPVDPQSGKVPAALADQVRRSMDSVLAIVRSGGGEIRDIVKVTIYLIDYEDFSTVGEIYGSFFDGPFPARTLVTVKHLPVIDGVQCRLIIEAVAALGS